MKNKIHSLISALLIMTAVAVFFLFSPNMHDQTYEPRIEKYAVGDANGAISWLNERRVNPETGTIDPKDIKLAFEQVQEMNQNNSKSLGLSWQEMGPDNIGGRTRAILIDRNNPDIIYAGGVAGGLWKSTTGGTSWFKVNDQFENLAIVSICQSSNGDIYFGTGEGMYDNSGTGTGGIAGQGIWKSTNNGSTFTRIPSTWDDAQSIAAFVNVNKLAADPVNPNRIYASTKQGLRMTNDGGLTWIKPINSTSSSSDVKVGSDGTVAASVGNKIYISANGDSGTFAIKTPATGQASTAFSRIEIAFAPSDPNYIYLLAYIQKTISPYNYQYKSMAFRSTDKGETWEIIGNEFTDEGFTVLGDQGTYDNTIAVFPDDKDKVILGGQLSIWIGKSYSGAWTWEPRSMWYLHYTNSGYVHADHHTIVFHPSNPQKLYIGCDGGISMSNDGGSTFQVMNRQYNVTQFYSVAFSGNGKIVGGTQDNGSLYINPANHLPQRAEDLSGGDGGYCVFSRLDPKVAMTTVYYGTVYHIAIDHSVELVYESNTGGSFVTPMALWEDFDDPYSIDTVMFISDKNYNTGDTLSIVSNYQNRIVTIVLDHDIQKMDTVFAIDHYQGLVAVGVGGGVILSRDVLYKSAGAIWYKPINASGVVNTMAFSSDGNYLYFGTSNAIYRSSNILQARDYGTMLLIQTKKIGAFGQAITDIAVDPDDPEKVIVTTGTYGTADHVYYSTNAASTSATTGNFTGKQGNLPDMPVYSGLINWSNSNTVVVGTEYGVFSTQDITADPPVWVSENNGSIANAPVFMLRQQTFENFWADGNSGVTNHGYIYAATHGRGIFMTKTLMGPVAVEDVTAGAVKAGIRVFPNPSADFISIDAGKQASDATLCITDINGKLLHQSTILKGAVIPNIDVSGYKKGVYFVILKSSGKTVSEKFIRM